VACRKSYTFTLGLEVYNEEALAMAAERKAVTNGLDLDAWQETRKVGGNPIASDIQMLLDPETLVGCHIHDINAVRTSDIPEANRTPDPEPCSGPCPRNQEVRSTSPSGPSSSGPSGSS
jgi:hypothetical protein